MAKKYAETMPGHLLKYCSLCIALFAVFFSASASANRLVVAEGAHWLAHVGAALILYAHIGAGALGILTGLIASLSKKGSTVHRKSGVVFFWSMFICFLIGAAVAPFLNSQQTTNFVAAVLALYLLVSGVSAARRRTFNAGFQEKLGVAVALVITIMGAVFMWLAVKSPEGSVDGSPPQAYILFVVAGSAALIGEIKVLMQGKLSQYGRIGRHLWRMSMAFFIASGSAFFGQAAFFPHWFNESPLPLILGFFPFAILVVYGGKYAWASTVQRRKVPANVG